MGFTGKAVDRAPDASVHREGEPGRTEQGMARPNVRPKPSRPPKRRAPDSDEACSETNDITPTPCRFAPLPGIGPSSWTRMENSPWGVREKTMRRAMATAVPAEENSPGRQAVVSIISIRIRPARNHPVRLDPPNLPYPPDTRAPSSRPPVQRLVAAWAESSSCISSRSFSRKSSSAAR